MGDDLVIGFSPKISPFLLSYFLRGIGCYDVLTVVEYSMEAWIDFQYRNMKFTAHRDIDEWRFFAGEGCPFEVREELRQKILSSGPTFYAFFPVLIGFFKRK